MVAHKAVLAKAALALKFLMALELNFYEIALNIFTFSHLPAFLNLIGIPIIRNY
jgi:hypothetical protein